MGITRKTHKAISRVYTIGDDYAWIGEYLEDFLRTLDYDPGRYQVFGTFSGYTAELTAVLAALDTEDLDTANLILARLEAKTAK